MSAAIKTHKQETINQLSDKDERWFAVYTKYKCEKFVAGQLAKKNIQAYVPLVAKTKRYSRKIKHYEVPLINCYVFVKIKKADYLRTLETEFVMKFLKNGNDLLAIPESEIQILKRVGGQAEETFENSSMVLDQGQWVEVVAGQLTGMKGKIMTQAGKKSFVVDLETIGYHLRVNIDLKWLRPIKENIVIS
ncbi:MAG: UpxY family transcription antiterminator [Saprospiraceae bacterium]|nr:UpxY family transcription antiterminator [Saprospiraceae bacterium]